MTRFSEIWSACFRWLGPYTFQHHHHHRRHYHQHHHRQSLDYGRLQWPYTTTTPGPLRKFVRMPKLSNNLSPHLSLALWYMSPFCSLTFYQKQQGKPFSFSPPLLILQRHIMAGWSVHSRNSFIRSTSLLPPALEIASPPQYDQILRGCTSCQSQSFRLRAFFLRQNCKSLALLPAAI